MSSSKHRLRRSCAFCRARKIKCSNEAICEACRRQGADCIYDFEPTRPKVRNSSHDSDSGLPGTPSRSRLSISASSSASPILGATNGGFNSNDAFGAPDDVENVASALEQTFFDNFAPHRGSFQGPTRPSSLSHHSDPNLESMARSFSMQGQQQTGNSTTYTGVLSLLTQDLVGLVTDQFGSLGCYHVETGQARFFLSGLANDETQTMFDEYEAVPTSSSNTSPVAELGQRQQTQLIDVWYSTHPLSFVISKTLLLRELRDGTHDEVLLAVILGEASLRTGDDTRGRSLLCWAAAQLRSRPLRGSHLTQNGVVSADASTPVFSGVSTRIFNGITTAQALVLLGWNALTSSRMRRATCYIGLAGKIVTDLKEQITTTADPKASSRINGIDVFDVEKELIDHLYWTTYAICLWAFVQTGNQQFAPPLPATQPSIFVPMTEATSHVIQLDKVSDNFNTLQTQTVAIRETWPLAHVASVVAYICTFYPPDSDVALWQSGPPVAQQRLHNGQPPSMDVGVVCHEITRVLTESINHFNNQTGDSASRSLVLAAYHTLAIHFLFPAQKEESFAHDAVDRFCSSTQEVLQSLNTMSDQPVHPFTNGPSLRPQLPGIFTLAVDTCSRAFSFVHHREGLINGANASTLESLAGRLYTSSKDDFLGQGSALRMARKQLKAFVRAVGGEPAQQSMRSPAGAVASVAASMAAGGRMGDQGGVDLGPTFGGHGLGVAPPIVEPTGRHSPRRSGSASTSGRSPSDSDHLSTASTAALDARLSMFSPYEANKLSSPVLSGATRPSAHTISSSSTAATNTGLLSPGDVFKPSWQTSGPDELFRSTGTLNPSALGISPGAAAAVAAAGGSDGLDLQHAPWFPQMSPGTMMDLDMAAGSMTGVQWGEWPDLNAEQMVAAGGGWDMSSTGM